MYTKNGVVFSWAKLANWPDSVTITTAEILVTDFFAFLEYLHSYMTLEYRQEFVYTITVYSNLSLID